MDGQEKLLDYETIKAAVAGEKWATEKVLQLKELSSYLGTTPETISRKLRELEQKKLIRRDRRKIVLLDQKRLEQPLL